jgi:hypothetical protein
MVVRRAGPICQQDTHEFSDPAGTKTPSASRYDLNASGRGIMVDFIDNEENVENQLENWKAITSLLVSTGQVEVMFIE